MNRFNTLVVLLLAFVITFTSAYYIPANSEDDHYALRVLNKRHVCPEGFNLKSNGKGLYFCILQLNTDSVMYSYCDMKSNYIGFAYDVSKYSSALCTNINPSMKNVNGNICTMDVQVPEFAMAVGDYCEFASIGYIGYKFQLDAEPECLDQWETTGTPRPRVITTNDASSVQITVRFMNNQMYNVYNRVQAYGMKPLYDETCLTGPNDQYDNVMWKMTQSTQCYREYQSTISYDALSLSNTQLWQLDSVDGRKATFTMNIGTSYSINDIQTNACNIQSFNTKISFDALLDIKFEATNQVKFEVKDMKLDSTNNAMLINGQLQSLASGAKVCTTFSDMRVTSKCSTKNGYDMCDMEFKLPGTVGDYVMTCVSDYSKTYKFTISLNVPANTIYSNFDASTTRVTSQQVDDVTRVTTNMDSTDANVNSLRFERAFMCCVPYGYAASVPVYSAMYGTTGCTANNYVTPKYYEVTSYMTRSEDLPSINNQYSMDLEVEDVFSSSSRASCSLLVVSTVNTPQRRILASSIDTEYVQGTTFFDVDATATPGISKNRPRFVVPLAVTLSVVGFLLFNAMLLVPIILALYCCCMRRSEKKILEARQKQEAPSAETPSSMV
jgi:hypothetical protein